MVKEVDLVMPKEVELVLIRALSFGVFNVSLYVGWAWCVIVGQLGVGRDWSALH